MGRRFVLSYTSASTKGRKLTLLGRTRARCAAAGKNNGENDTVKKRSLGVGRPRISEVSSDGGEGRGDMVGRSEMEISVSLDTVEFEEKKTSTVVPCRISAFMAGEEKQTPKHHPVKGGKGQVREHLRGPTWEGGGVTAVNLGKSESKAAEPENSCRLKRRGQEALR